MHSDPPPYMSFVHYHRPRKSIPSHRPPPPPPPVQRTAPRSPSPPPPRQLPLPAPPPPEVDTWKYGHQRAWNPQDLPQWRSSPNNHAVNHTTNHSNYIPRRPSNPSLSPTSSRPTDSDVEMIEYDELEQEQEEQEHQPVLQHRQPLHQPAHQPVQHPVHHPVHHPVQSLVQHLVRQPVQQPTQQPVHPVRQPVQPPVHQPVHQPVQRPAHHQQPAQQPVHPSVQQHAHQPVQQPAHQPVQQPVQHPVQHQLEPIHRSPPDLIKGTMPLTDSNGQPKQPKASPVARPTPPADEVQVEVHPKQFLTTDDILQAVLRSGCRILTPRRYASPSDLYRIEGRPILAFTYVYKPNLVMLIWADTIKADLSDLNAKAVKRWTIHSTNKTNVCRAFQEAAEACPTFKLECQSCGEIHITTGELPDPITGMRKMDTFVERNVEGWKLYLRNPVFFEQVVDKVGYLQRAIDCLYSANGRPSRAGAKSSKGEKPPRATKSPKTPRTPKTPKVFKAPRAPYVFDGNGGGGGGGARVPHPHPPTTLAPYPPPHLL